MAGVFQTAEKANAPKQAIETGRRFAKAQLTMPQIFFLKKVIEFSSNCEQTIHFEIMSEFSRGKMS